MFTSWTRHGKLNNGHTDVDRTPSQKQNPTEGRLTGYLQGDALPGNKPKGRRLTDDGSRFLKVSTLCDSWTRDWRQHWDGGQEDDADRPRYQGAMSSDLTRATPANQVRTRMRGPASSGTALSTSSYQILLPQRSTPVDQTQPQIRFSTQTPSYPSWAMSVGVPQHSKRVEDLRRRMEVGPGSANLVSENQRLHQTPCASSGNMSEIPSIMVDPYSSAAREFIASRQLLFLTRRRIRTVTQEPHVWIVNYYGRTAAKAVHSKVMPGSSLTLADTAAMGRQYRNNDPLRMTRLLGYQEIDDSNPLIEKGKMRFIRLIGRGGTSAVYSGGMEVSWDNAMLDTPSPVVAKILNPKHWKCALAELVASAAAIHRVSEGSWLMPDRRRGSCARSEITSPTSASSRSFQVAEEASPFVQGGAWLMPTELHLFWDFDRPVAGDWSPLKKKIDCTAHPRFSQNELPSLCCLVLRNCEDGVPLLTWLNTVYVKRRRKPSHEMCLYFAYTIITLVRQLHSCGLIHGDIKPDNFVLLSTSSPYAGKQIFGDVQVTHPLLQQSTSGICPVTITGIDFGRSLDVKEALRDVIFIGDTQVSDFRCPSMLEKARWETQIDLTGLAVTIFTMISLKYPKIRKKKAEAMMMSSLSLGEARGKVNYSYWFGSRIRGDMRQNEFWMGILDRLINFDPFHTSDGHTLLDSCLLLRQLETELIGLFQYSTDGYGPPVSALRASYDALYAELNEMHEFVLDYQKKGGGAAGGAPGVMI